MVIQRIRSFVVAGVLLALALAQIASAQQGQAQTGPPKVEASSQPAVATLRAITRAIGECPEIVDRVERWGNGPLEVERWYFGSPKNIVWDIVPSNTPMRSPYLGYIEFSVSHYHWVPPETREKYDRDLPPSHLNIWEMGDRKFRYEFDVGPEGVQLTRALDRYETATRWEDFQKRDVCWDNAARNTSAPAGSSAARNTSVPAGSSAARNTSAPAGSSQARETLSRAGKLPKVMGALSEMAAQMSLSGPEFAQERQAKALEATQGRQEATRHQHRLEEIRAEQDAITARSEIAEQRQAQPAPTNDPPRSTGDSSTPVVAQNHKNPVVHKFLIWGTLNTKVEKLGFLWGFTNGLFKGPRSEAFFSLMACMEDVDPDQAIAMIDKYYRENPEKWSAPVGNAIISAITVKGGPCEGVGSLP